MHGQRRHISFSTAGVGKTSAILRYLKSFNDDDGFRSTYTKKELANGKLIMLGTDVCCGGLNDGDTVSL